MINNNNEILRWIDALHSNGGKSILTILLIFLHINILNEMNLPIRSNI